MNQLEHLLHLQSPKEHLTKLVDKYRINPGMNPQQVFDAFVDTEQSLRPEFMRRGETHTDPKKRFYWFQRATGLTTAGGQNRLNKLLNLSLLAQRAMDNKSP